MEHDAKLCLACARRRLAKRPPVGCADCALLNMDPLAQVRATYARPSPLAGFTFVLGLGGDSGVSLFHSGAPLPEVE